VSFFAPDASWLAILAGTDRNRATGSCRLPAVDIREIGTPDGFAGHEDVGENSAELSQTGRLVIQKNLAERGGLYCAFFHNSLVFCPFVGPHAYKSRPPPVLQAGGRGFESRHVHQSFQSFVAISAEHLLPQQVFLLLVVSLLPPKQGHYLQRSCKPLPVARPRSAEVGRFWSDHVSAVA